MVNHLLRVNIPRRMTKPGLWKTPLVIACTFLTRDGEFHTSGMKTDNTHTMVMLWGFYLFACVEGFDAGCGVTYCGNCVPFTCVLLSHHPLLITQDSLASCKLGQMPTWSLLKSVCEIVYLYVVCKGARVTLHRDTF